MIIAVYGTLKEGHYNYDRLELHKHKRLGDSKVTGAMQLAPQGYPYLFKADEDIPMFMDYDLEVYEVDEKTADFIRYMEVSSGYYADKIDTEFGIATIYYSEMTYYNADMPLLTAYTKDILESLLTK